MLKKIVLKNVASYKEKPITIEFDKKVNLLYGLNGAGKSTLSNYLATPNDSMFSECQLTIDAEDSFYVYNQKFVNENFITNSGLPGIFTLSKDNGEILKEIDEKEERRRKVGQQIQKNELETKASNDELFQKRQKIINKVWKIKETYYGGDRVLEFCFKGKIGSKNDLFEYLLTFSKPEKVDYSLNEIKKEAQDILGDAQKLLPLKRVELRSYSIDDESLLKKQIVGNKNSSVSILIDNLKNDDWVRQGLGYIKDVDFTKADKVDCPFCQELTITEKLIESIKSYFDIAYENDIKRLKVLSSELQKSIDSLPDEKSFTDHKKIEEYSNEFLLKFRELKSQLLEGKRKVDAKINSPAVPVVIEVFQNKLDEVNEIIDHVNELVRIHNEKIDNAEEVSESIKKKFWDLMRFNYGSEIESFLSEKKTIEDQLMDFSKEEIELKTELATIGNQIVELQKKTVNIDEAIANISGYLKDMGITHFELVKHENSNSYKIQREGHATNIYESLSEGEKTIISFLYFVEQCKGRKSPSEISNKKVIVIDDPVSSLSHMFVFNIGRLIKSEFFESKKYEQVIVLTHSLYFFHELVRPKRGNEDASRQDFFRVIKTSEGSKILRMTSSEIQNEYQSYWSVIKEKTTPEVLLANCMRNVLEHFFGFIQSHESINNIFQQATLKDNKFQSFLRYMDRGSHSNITNISDYKEINHDNFREAFRLVFEVNGHGDHYKKMMA